jgi:hypothetical protein
MEMVWENENENDVHQDKQEVPLALLREELGPALLFV